MTRTEQIQVSPLHSFDSRAPSRPEHYPKDRGQISRIAIRIRANGSSDHTSVVPNCIRANWTLYQKAGLPSELQQRLFWLASLDNGWRGRGSAALKVDSMATFLRGCTVLPSGWKVPFVSLTASGRLSLEWHSSWARHLDVEFLENGEAIFGLLSGRATYEGKDKVENVIKAISGISRRAFSWQSRS